MHPTHTGTKKDFKWQSWIPWIGLVLFVLFIRFTGPGTVVLGWMQQAILSTGIMQPSMRYAEENNVKADYSLTLTTLEGESVSLADFRGKAIFMNFWATWCAPCLAEYPFIESLYDEMKNENVVFLMIGTDNDPAIVQKFITAKGYKTPVYRLAGVVPEMYQVRTLPTTFVISPNGDMATVHVGMANYNTRGFRSFLKQIANQPFESGS